MKVELTHCAHCPQFFCKDSNDLDTRCYTCRHAKFPIGARVTHPYAGPGTVIGHPFPGVTGDTILPVKFDNPSTDGSSGWFERLFTLIEPRKAVSGDIYPNGYYGKDYYTARVPFHGYAAARDLPITFSPFQYAGSTGSTDGFAEWMKNPRTVGLKHRCAQAEKARDQQSQNFLLQEERTRNLQRELEGLQRKLKNYEPVNLYDGLSIGQWRERALEAESELRSVLATNKVYQEQNARKRAQIANLIETLDTVRKAVQ
jgi:hypothetical protein